MSRPMRRTFSTKVSKFRTIKLTLVILLGSAFAVSGVALSQSAALRERLGLSAPPAPAVERGPSPLLGKKKINLLKMAGFDRTTSLVAATPIAPTVTATKTDTLFTDVDGDLLADPGDTLKYTVGISASGEDATGVTFTDTVDPNTAFVPGSLR